MPRAKILENGLTIKQICEKTGLDRHTIWSRITKLRWPLEKIMREGFREGRNRTKFVSRTSLRRHPGEECKFEPLEFDEYAKRCRCGRVSLD